MNFILNWKKQIKNQENLNVFSCLYYSSQTIEETLKKHWMRMKIKLEIKYLKKRW
jgi:hypothetical protein